ncbi:MAG: hypothetical protein H6Q26_1491 [Bacteroidetes bacterium]|nr:hypothetical protein [Bacteroidota bacterium]
MKAFVVLVKVPLTYTTEQAKAVNPQWEKAIADWKASGHYITSFAYPGESKVIAQQAETKNPAHPEDSNVTTQQATIENLKQVSSILLRAENIDEATILAQSCPILKYGGSVEIREIPKGEPAIFPPLQ